MDWAPAAGTNCLIGPGDSCKTTILDGIELVLNPRSNFLCEDTDFHNLDLTTPATITVTLVGLPDTFCSDARYGLQLRGWDADKGIVVDEPSDREEALSLRLTLEPAALQHNADGSHIALVDEIEHGLESHRILRLLTYLRNVALGDGQRANGEAVAVTRPQVFITTHSPVVIRELQAGDLRAVRQDGGTIKVADIAGSAEPLDEAQRHLRSNPEAFLARRILVGEGKTEYGLSRGLDTLWTDMGSLSFAYQGVVAVNGGGVPAATTFARHLRDLGYEVLVLLDSDEPPPLATLDALRAQGCRVVIWPDACSTEQRMFLDLPWPTIRELVELAISFDGADWILHTINAALPEGTIKLTKTAFPAEWEVDAFRRVLGTASKTQWRSRDLAFQAPDDRTLGTAVSFASGCKMSQLLRHLIEMAGPLLKLGHVLPGP